MKHCLQHCIGYMAGWTIHHWAEAMLLGFNSSKHNAIGQQKFT